MQVLLLSLALCVFISGCAADRYGAYVGCFVDSTSRVLKAAETSGNWISQDSCRNFCFKRRLRLAGVEYGKECFCGNVMDTRHGEVGQHQCTSYRCYADSKAYCGGDWRLLVTETAAAYQVESLKANYMGCYIDPSKGARLFQGATLVKDGIMTNHLCHQYCKDLGYSFAGTEYGEECYCSNLRPSYKFLADAHECAMRCEGNAEETCGGELRLSVYDITGESSNPVGDYYKGCYSEFPILDTVAPQSHMTPEYCAGTCYKRSYQVSATYQRFKCACAISVSEKNALRDTDCDLPCLGDDRLNCGGRDGQYSVYRTTIPPSYMSAEKTQLVGCFQDSTRRMLKGISMTDTSLTVDSCIMFCSRKGYRYAGMQYGEECYCGDRVEEYRRVGVTECSATCRGNQYQKCGGDWRLSVYNTTIPDQLKTVRNAEFRPSTTTTTTTTTSTTPAPPTSTCPPAACQPSVSRVSGVEQCQQTTIFAEEFVGALEDTWSFSSFMPDKEFVVFREHPDNVYLKDGVLFIRPTLMDEATLRNGTLHLQDCTATGSWGQCSRQAGVSVPLPPVYSARMHTKDSFGFRYGVVEIRAKLPRGDWIVPELWLEPRKGGNGGASRGRIRMAMALGNVELYCGGESFGNSLLEQGVQLVSGDVVNSFIVADEQQVNNTYFHVFKFFWTPEDLMFSVDDETPKKLVALDRKFGRKNELGGGNFYPFDQEFYISLGVTVGGTWEFPDECTSGTNEKPWRNKDPEAMKRFYDKRDEWYPTWDDEESALRVDYVRVTTI